MKQTIKLTETELKGIISESINKILSEEFDWRTLRNAADKAIEKANDPTVTDWERQRRQNQANTFFDAAEKRFRTQYGIDAIKDRREKHELEKSLGKDVGDFNYTNGELKRLDRRERDKNDFYNGKQEFRDGRWQNKIATDEAINRIVKESVKKIVKETIGDGSFPNADALVNTTHRRVEQALINAGFEVEEYGDDINGNGAEYFVNKETGERVEITYKWNKVGRDSYRSGKVKDAYVWRDNGEDSWVGKH